MRKFAGNRKRVVFPEFGCPIRATTGGVSLSLSKSIPEGEWQFAGVVLISTDIDTFHPILIHSASFFLRAIIVPLMETATGSLNVAFASKVTS